MPLITVTDLTFSYDAEPLLAHVSFTVPDGERACLIGPNGCGKTTLLALVAGTLEPDAGTVTVNGTALPAPSHRQGEGHDQASGGVGTGTTAAPDATAQEWSAHNVEDYLATALAGVRALTARFEQVAVAIGQATGPEAARLAAEYDSLLATLEATDAWTLPERTEQALAGLGLAALNGDGRTRPLGTLSGGQRVRLTLAATLLASPAVLLLDEPTNHLDDDAVAWLTGYLTSFPGPVLMTSHDRAFIEVVATCLLDLDTEHWQALATASGAGSAVGVERRGGSYTAYLADKAAARAAHEEVHAAQQSRKQALTAHRDASMRIAAGGVHLKEASGTAKKFYSDRAAATSVRRTRGDDRRLEALAEREVRKPRGYHLHLDLGTGAGTSSGVAVAARQAGVAGRLSPLDLDLRAGEHLLVTGANGAGKSTLLTWVAAGGDWSVAQRLGLAGQALTDHAPEQVPACQGGPGTPASCDRVGGSRDGLVEPAVVLAPTGRVEVAGPVAWVPQRLPQAGDVWMLTGLEPGREEAGLRQDERWARAWDQGIGVLGDGDLGAGVLHPRLWHRAVGELSAGNQRRVQLALAAAQVRAGAGVLVVDEPTNYLDLDTIEALESALVGWAGTVMIASHDRWLIDHWAGRRLGL